MKFSDLHEIYQGNQSTVFKGMVSNSHKEVVIKVLNSEFPTALQIERFKNEYEFTRELNIPGIRQVIGMDQQEGKTCLIFEHFGRQTLKEFIADNHDAKSLIRIACKISQILGEIHQRNIIHKDINSNNILINDNHEIRIIDFELATRFTLKTQNLSNPDHLEGTLTYISPEQTGRMNRSVDYRSDLYSIGVVLYEIFTGRLPFLERDHMELIHSHIARNPLSPFETGNLPVMDRGLGLLLSDIILKLLSKNAEDRYQSAFGLKYDLEASLNLKSHSDFQNFRLGEKDFAGRLIIPEKLYGRNDEVKKLYEIYENICEGETDLLLVSGLPGVGKSALIHEIHRVLAEKSGYYIEGKFDQYQKDIPYYAIIQAFNALVSIILKESEEKLEYWTSLIQEAVGNIGAVLINLIPDLELIIGKQPELPKLEGKEALNRFNYAWSNFVKTIARADHPLVLFIDDLHSADNSSIELLRSLLSDNEIQHLFCIVAFRDNEINIADIQVFESIENINITRIQLQNLSQDDVNNLLSDSLVRKNGSENGHTRELKELACLISSKTLGNPFFTRQFLINLYEEACIRFDYSEITWIWDFEQIKKMNITDNVVKLMSNKVQKLPVYTRETLKIAACIGNLFDLNILSVLNKKDQDTTKKELEPAILENLIVPVEMQHYKFVHDRIQQAVYDTITEEERSSLHLQTGKLLLKHFCPEELESQIFEVANQLNHGKELIEDPSEKMDLAELNLKAGIKAKKSAAYLPAYNYLKNSRDLLPKNCWQNEYEFTLKLFDELSEISYLAHKYRKTESYAVLIKHNARDILDICNSYHALLNSYRARLKYQEAVETGLQLLAQLGHKIPINPSRFFIIKEFLRTQIVIAGKDTVFFENLPMMTDKKKLAIVKIMDALATCSYYGYPNLFPIMCFRPIRMSVKHGQTEQAPLVFIGYAIALSIMKKFDKAIVYARLGERLIVKLDTVQQKAKILYILHYFILIWKNRLHSIIPELEQVYKIGPEIGDFEFAGYAIMSTFLSIYCDMPLQQLQTKQKARANLVIRTNQKYAINFSPFSLQVFENLITFSDHPTLLQGEYFDEKEAVEKFIANNDRGNLIHYYSIKILLCLIYEETELAEEYLEGAQNYKNALRGNYYYAVGDFFRSLISIKIYEENPKKELLILVKKNQAQMKNWAKHNQVNFQHKFDLVEAERLRIRGRNEEAKELYDKAIFGAKEHEFFCDEALSRQFAGQFYLGIEKKHLAEFYLQGAYNCYRKWEAFGVCQFLEEKYPQFQLARKSRGSSSEGGSFRSTGSSKTEASDFLDLTSIVKASSTLSGEVKLEHLLNSMLKIIMENAGAEYAVIIKNNEGKYTIEAKGRYDQGGIEVLQSEDLHSTSEVALNVVNYVIRTRKPLVIDNALEDTEISKNDYIERNQVKSIFCYPVVNKNKLVAILYLENNLTTHAFTSERVETINILSSQIAISIENALLYGQLEDKVNRRTMQLQKAKEKIEESHRQITDSINYASRIQNAILPTEEIFKENFRDYFIIFKPRDVVSGDFYWAKQVNEFLIFAAADCTGHGVPGAFVSMLGISFLNEIVRKREVKKASQMLEELRIQVKTSMHQTGGITEAKDGMDIALFIIDTKTKELQFAGANNPLYLIRNKSQNPDESLKSHLSLANNEFQLYEIKGDHQPIGIYWEETEFTNHTFQLKDKDSLYIFSDGLVDQFGGENRKKFKSCNFKKLLLSIQTESLDKQKEVILETFETWKRSFEQIDDICIIGVRE